MREILKILMWIIIAAVGLALLLPILLWAGLVILLWVYPDTPKLTAGELSKEGVTSIMDSYSNLETGEYELLYSISHYSSGIPTRIDNDFVIRFDDDKLGNQILNNSEWQPLTEPIDQAYPLSHIIEDAKLGIDISGKILCYERLTSGNGSKIYLFYDQDKRILYGRDHDD